MTPHFKEKLHKIKSLVFDVDGVFSQFFVVEKKSEFLRVMNAKDGFAMRYAIEKGFKVAIITGGVSETVKDRFESLGITDIYLGERTKINALEDFCRKYNLTFDEVLYMGDDLPDYEVLTKVGISTCPADSVREILEICEYISERKAGEGCVRDVIEQVLRAQNKWNYLNETLRKNDN